MRRSLLNTKAKNNNVTYDEVIKRYENFKNRQERMTQEQRESYKNLLKELEGENNNQVKQILQLALDLDEKGEFYKFIEVFGDGGIDDQVFELRHIGCPLAGFHRGHVADVDGLHVHAVAQGIQVLLPHHHVLLVFKGIEPLGVGADGDVLDVNGPDEADEIGRAHV